MQLSRKWLNEFVELDTPDREFAEAMTMSGSKVEITKVLSETMHGVVVNSQGEVNQYTEYQVGQFTVSGSIHEETDKTATMKLRIIMPENFRYMFNTADHPSERTKYISTNRKYFDDPYYVFSHFVNDRFATGATVAYMALDQEKEFIIINWYVDQDLYLVASTDPITDPKEILTYFEAFIEEYDESHVNG